MTSFSFDAIRVRRTNSYAPLCMENNENCWNDYRIRKRALLRLYKHEINRTRMFVDAFPKVNCEHSTYSSTEKQTDVTRI